MFSQDDPKDTEQDGDLDQTTAPIDHIQEGEDTPLDETRADMKEFLGSDVYPRRDRH